VKSSRGAYLRRLAGVATALSATVPTTTAFDAQQYASTFPPGIEHLYWHRGRNRILMRQLAPRVSKSDLILDVGCGPGVAVDYLRRAGFHCEGVEPGHPTYQVPGTIGHLHTGQDALTLPSEYRARVYALLLLDVLEHIEDPGAFFRECDEAFPNLRWLFVTVPARMELWSNYDEEFGHYRRYSLESLRATPVPPRFTLEDAGYFFHSLYWVARALKVFTANRNTVVRTPRPPLVHDMIGRLLAFEERHTSGASPGSSLYGVYRRR